MPKYKTQLKAALVAVNSLWTNFIQMRAGNGHSITGALPGLAFLGEARNTEQHKV